MLRLADARARSVAIAATAAAVLAVARGVPFAWWPDAAFDSDQAVAGLMAKHLAEGRAFPMFFYGQPYMLAVQAWLAAPLFLIGGASVWLLKLPLLVINGAVAAGLVWALANHARLGAAAALLSSLFFTIAPPVAGGQLVAAMSGAVDPFLYILIIWWLRARPWACGLAAGFGTLNREFSAYGVVALVVTEALTRPDTWSRLLPRWITIAGVMVAVLEVGRVAMPLNDAFGPEMPALRSFAGVSGIEAAAARMECSQGREVAVNLRWLAVHTLPTLAGVRARGLNEYYVGLPTDASPWTGLLLGGLLLATLGRTAVLGFTSRAAPAPVLVFLFITGLAALAFYAGSCRVQDPTLIRYTMLALLIPIASTAAYLQLEPRRALRTAALLLAGGWGVWSASRYVPLVADYLAAPPATPQSIAADELERRGIGFGRAGYWDAYYITFRTSERVVLASDSPLRIFTYDTVVSRAPGAVVVQPGPCRGGERAGALWICP